LQEWEFLLEELSLYFLMYSEGANLRHTPEALWFLFWCLRNSHTRQMQITAPPPTDKRSAVYVGESIAVCIWCLILCVRWWRQHLGTLWLAKVAREQGLVLVSAC
jgi:hypothetical protein